MKIRTYCRLCEGSCGLIADVESGQLVALTGDESDPVSAGYICDVARSSVSVLEDESRIKTPLRRTEDGWESVSWSEAIAGIADALKTVQKRGGPRSLGMYLGHDLLRSDRGYVRSLAAAISLGTPSVFSELVELGGARLVAAERVLGHAVPLLPDVGRAHYVVAMGGEQDSLGWGPLVRGRVHDRWLGHSRRTKGTKLVVVGPRRTAMAEDATQYLPIRPGTEAFFLLGMLVAAVKGGWHDPQFVRDYTSGWDALVEALSGWSVEQCAQMCGVEAADLSGVALKFCRSAMSVIAPDAGTFANRHGSLGAWAWLTLHTITANTLRPGGLYDHEAIFDLHHVLAFLKREKAPRTRVAQRPLTLMQAAAAELVDEVLVPGEGQVRALICVRGNPLNTLPDPERVTRALDELDCLVCLATHHDETTQKADWVLPLVHSWERDDLETVSAALLPRDASRFTPALVQPPDQSRHEDDVLASLVGAVGNSRGEWGWSLSLVGRRLVRSDLSRWERQLAGWLDEADWSVWESQGGRDRGDSDRSLWRVSTQDGRLQLYPTGTQDLLNTVESGTDDGRFPLWLRSSSASTVAPDGVHGPSGEQNVRLHSDHGFESGVRVRLTSAAGTVEAVVCVDDGLRPDVVDVPRESAPTALALLSGTRVDALSGAVARDGIRCRVERV